MGFAGLALGVERVEALLRPFLGGLAGVDGTANGSDPRDRRGVGGLLRLRIGRDLLALGGPFHVASGPPSGRGPKKRGPDQWPPVIASAMPESDAQVRPFHSNPRSTTVTS